MIKTHELNEPITITMCDRLHEILVEVDYSYVPAIPENRESPAESESVELITARAYYLNNDGEKMPFNVWPILALDEESIKDEIMGEI